MSALYGYMDMLSIVAVHIASKLTNVGRLDGKVVGGATQPMILTDFHNSWINRQRES